VTDCHESAINLSKSHDIPHFSWLDPLSSEIFNGSPTQVLALNYPKTLSAAVACAVRTIQAPEPRILVIGLGALAAFNVAFLGKKADINLQSK